MRLSRRMLVVAVLLTSALAAASEFPELLTLTDNVSNDYELTCQGQGVCSAQQIVRGATTPVCWLNATNSPVDFPALCSSTLSFEENAYPPLSILGVQRK